MRSILLTCLFLSVGAYADSAPAGSQEITSVEQSQPADTPQITDTAFRGAPAPARGPVGGPPAGGGFRGPVGGPPAGGGFRGPVGGPPAGGGFRGPVGGPPAGGGFRGPVGGPPAGGGFRGPVGGPPGGFRGPVGGPPGGFRGPIGPGIGRGPIGPGFGGPGPIFGGRPGWGWRPGGNWFVQPGWWAPTIALPWIPMAGIPTGYWQCTAYNTQYQPFSAWGVDIDQAALSANNLCEQNSGGQYCYIPQNYCQPVQ